MAKNKVRFHSPIPWNEVDSKSLETDVEHIIPVQREAIPLIFVPGIMGSRLRRTGTQVTGPDGKPIMDQGFPNLRWDPSPAWLFHNYAFKSPQDRRSLLVGTSGGVHDENFLEVDDHFDSSGRTIGDGFRGIMTDYWEKFLRRLKGHNWGALDKIFVFPVYAFGYNWTNSNRHSGAKLKVRIGEIIEEANTVIGLCKKVILITHSMGGLVARSASQLHGAENSILGIIHGVQPATGGTSAYWRMKAGVENPTSMVTSPIKTSKGYGASIFLGDSGPKVTAVLGNIPGGLEILPNKSYRTNDGAVSWLLPRKNDAGLRLTQTVPICLPISNPYKEIYKIPARVYPNQRRNSTNAYWGLVDPALLDPDLRTTRSPSPNNSLSIEARADSWTHYKELIDAVETFHDDLGKGPPHPNTFCFHGTGYITADIVEFHIELPNLQYPYPLRGFCGFITNDIMTLVAKLQDPFGDGDGTVSVSSASALNRKGDPASGDHPGDRALPIEHQPAYEAEAARRYTVQAIIAMCRKYIETQHG